MAEVQLQAEFYLLIREGETKMISAAKTKKFKN